MTKKSAPTPAPKAARPITGEIQTLADLALKAWESGVGEDWDDENGDLWQFEPVRDEHSRLVIRRYVPPPLDEKPYKATLTAEGQMPAYAFGLDGTRDELVERLTAMAKADPA